MLSYILKLLTPIAILAASENDFFFCDKASQNLVYTNWSQDITNVQFVSVYCEVQSNVLQNFSEASKLYILDSNITSFSLESEIQYLNVTNSVFPKVTRDVLKGCTSLIFVEFTSNPSLEFEGSPFKDLDRLLFLTIANQSLPTVKRELFSGLEKLFSLVLIRNGIREIDEDSFTDLLELKGLCLDGNPIQSFGANLSRLTSLSDLSLFDTNLKRIEYDVLAAAESLRTICLSLATLKNINATELHKKVPNLKAISVLYWEQSCPEVKLVLADWKKLGLQMENVTEIHLLSAKKFLPITIC